MVFAARQLQEKCQEQNQALYSTFVDLTKAFYTVRRIGLKKKSQLNYSNIDRSLVVNFARKLKIDYPFLIKF